MAGVQPSDAEVGRPFGYGLRLHRPDRGQGARHHRRRTCGARPDVPPPARGASSPTRATRPRSTRATPDDRPERLRARRRRSMDLAVRSLAAAVLVGEHGVLGGYSAAELLGASCGPLDAPGRGHRARAAARPAGPAWSASGTCRPPSGWSAVGAAVTSPVRTALDLACRGSLVAAVVWRRRARPTRFGFPPRDVMPLRLRPPGQAGIGAAAAGGPAGQPARRVADGDAHPPRDRPRRTARAAAAGAGRAVPAGHGLPRA